MDKWENPTRNGHALTYLMHFFSGCRIAVCLAGTVAMVKKLNTPNDREGVSPVIATILMVAVTVVLAAILYVMASGIASNDTDVTPMISAAKSSDDHNIVWTVSAIAGSHAVLRIDVYIQLMNESGFVIQTEPLISQGATPGCSGTHGFNYTPASAGNSIGVGDIFIIDKAYNQGCSLTLVTPGATALYVKFTV